MERFTSLPLVVLHLLEVMMLSVSKVKKRTIRHIDRIVIFLFLQEQRINNLLNQKTGLCSFGYFKMVTLNSCIQFRLRDKSKADGHYHVVQLMKCWKYLAITFVCISLALLSYGCPYDSQFPLGPASESKIDERLIGAWQIAPGKGSSGGAVIIYPFNETEFIIVLQEAKKNEGDIFLLKAFVTTIGDAKFLNVEEIGPVLQKKWYLVNYSLSGDTLITRTVQDRIFKDRKIASSDELRGFIERNLGNNDLYSFLDDGSEKRDELVLKRITK